LAIALKLNQNLFLLHASSLLVMKNALLLLAGATALSLASCSSNTTSETTTTTAAPTDSTATASTTTTTVSDETYHSRGNRMADKFASSMKISDEATREKLRTAYYNRSKRYDELMAKYKADTAGLGAARRQYYQDTDNEFKTILVVPAQYSAYESSRSTYDESNNLDTTDQTADASSAAPSDSSSMSSTTTTSTTTTTEESAMSGGADVAKGKSKMTDGSKVKVKDNGKVKVKDAAGNKAKM
jgi:hypothetical protein